MLIVCSITGSVVSAHRIRRLFSKKVAFRNSDVVVLGTFYNAGWFEAHIIPLTRSAHIRNLYIICDDPLPATSEKIIFCCPTNRMKRILGRQFSRLCMLLSVGWKHRPALYMGYHVMPNAPLALLGASVFGGKSIYQMTGGPIQVVEGGYRSENPLLRATMRPSRVQENLIFSMLRSMDAIVVRGNNALNFVRENSLSDHSFIITGAVDVHRFTPSSADKKFDLIYVGRIIEVKGIDLLLNVVRLLSIQLPNIRVALVGDGRDRGHFESETKRMGIEHNVYFVGKSTSVELELQRGRAFILLSENEGMSIAAIEAMAAGLPVICRDVGDLGDLIVCGENGILIEGSRPESIATQVLDMFDDPDVLLSMGSNARDRAEENYSHEAMSCRWDRELKRLFSEETKF